MNRGIVSSFGSAFKSLDSFLLSEALSNHIKDSKLLGLVTWCFVSSFGSAFNSLDSFLLLEALSSLLTRFFFRKRFSSHLNIIRPKSERKGCQCPALRTMTTKNQ
jgi:hypothetical protein